MDGLGVDLSFQCRRDQHVYILTDPGISIFQLIACLVCQVFIHRAILVGDALQVARLYPLGVADGIGQVILPVPVGYTGHFAS